MVSIKRHDVSYTGAEISILRRCDLRIEWDLDLLIMYKFGGEKHRKTKEFGFQIILVRNSHVSTCLKKIKVLCRRTPQYPKSEGSRKTCRASYSGSMKALICSKGMSLAGRLQATGLIFSTAIKTIHVTYPVLFID